MYLCFLRYGFVEFEDTRDADDAVYELNGKELCGERVIVEHARGPRRDRDRDREGYGGGGYGGGGRSKYTHHSLEHFLFQAEIMVLYNNSYLLWTDRGHKHPVINMSSLLKAAAPEASKEGILVSEM